MIFPTTLSAASASRAYASGLAKSACAPSWRPSIQPSRQSTPGCPAAAAAAAATGAPAAAIAGEAATTAANDLRASDRPQATEATTATDQVETSSQTKMVAYRCPTCRELVSSMDAALAHCPSSVPSEVVDALTEGKAQSKAHVESSPTEAPADVDQAPPLPEGEPIAYDEHGRPWLVRWTDEETGAARTVVRNEDGSQRSFGESTVSSLLSSETDEAAKWADALSKDLSKRELRGLSHELGQRLLQTSQLYQQRHSELEQVAAQLDFQFFGIDSASASSKDLDNAYRQIARKMHPDKNGGTDQAKERFQKMKERYERLKKRMGGTSQEDTTGQAADDDIAESRNDSAEDGGHSGQEDCGDSPGDEDEEQQQKGDSDKSEKSEGDAASEDSKPYDINDKDSIVRMVSKYAHQLKDMQEKFDVLVKELERVRPHVQLSS